MTSTNEKAARGESGGSSKTNLIDQPFGEGCCQRELANSLTIGSDTIALSRTVFKSLEDAAPNLPGCGDDRHLYS